MCFIQCITLCDGLKRLGHLLEPDHGGKLDLLQMYLTDICKDARVDVSLRLNILEIIELRSLGWNSNPVMESFYQEKKSMLEKKKEKSPGKQVTSLASMGDSQQSLTSVEMVQPRPPANQEQLGEYLAVNLDGETVQLFLSSANAHLTRHAKLILSQHFASKSSSGSSIGVGVRYSREDLLSMAMSPSVWEKPDLPNIPEITRK